MFYDDEIEEVPELDIDTRSLARRAALQARAEGDLGDETDDDAREAVGIRTLELLSKTFRNQIDEA